MAEGAIRVLLVDDDEDDFFLARDLLADVQGSTYVLDWEPDGDRALGQLCAGKHDVYLLDYRLGKHSGLELLREAVRRGARGPYIILTGQGQRELDLEAMRCGAADYLEKGQLTAALLERSIRYALAQKRQEGDLERRVRERTAELAESQRFLRSVLDALPSHVAVLDESGVIIAVNEAWRGFAQANGLAVPGYGVGASYLAVCGAAPKVGEGIREVLGGRRPAYRTEYPCHSPSEQRWFQLRVTRFPGPGPVRVVVTHEDISHRVLSEQAIRRRSEQLQELARIAGQVNVAQDLHAVMGVITEAARRVIGAHQAITTHAPDQDWSRSISAVSLSPKYEEWRGYEARRDGAGIYRLVAQHNKAMRLTQQELEAHPAWRGFSDQADRHPPLRGWLAAPLVSRDGLNLGVIQVSDRYEGEFTIEDESILVQLARMASAALENTRLYHDLREADRLKDEFLAMLAHELRNPLAPISNAMHLIRLHSGDGSDEVREAHETMERQLEHLVRLVDDLLDVSRITRGKIKLQVERTDLAAVVTRAVEGSRPLIEARGHTLEVRVPEGPLPLEGDPVRLAQVLLNLLNNAAKYTPEGGRITLAVERRGGEVVVRVRDTGMGIPPAMINRIFDLFIQVDRTIERAEGGLGIGLTLVKRLTEMHGGSVRAASAGPGKGSEFSVRLPLVDEPEVVAARPAAPTPPPAPPKRRILVVDDNRDSARSLATLLRIMGHEVRTAEDGPGGVREVQAFAPEVVLLDIGMPGMNGFDVARSVRGLPGLAQPLLVAMTGFGSEEDRRQAAEAGFDAHLVKPVDLEALKGLLARPVAP